MNAEAAKLAKKTDALVAVGHIGGDGTVLTAPTGQLMDLANGLTGVDVVLGGHTHTEYITTAANGVLVAESPNSGTQFTRIRVVVNTKSNEVVYKTADYHKTWDIGVTPDPEISAYVDDLNAQLAPIFSTIIGNSTKAIPRADQCGRPDGRLCESLIGNVVTDAYRATYNTDFAISNSGGLRADLTCPTVDLAGDFCSAFTPPPFPISRGQNLAVLPFGNLAFTVTIHGGAELKTFLENGVSLMPSAQGRFPQVSGLCFTYDISAPAGNRVKSAVRQAADGTCTGAAIDLTSSSPDLTLVENDFMATGGDGYPNVYARGTIQNIADQVVADYVSTHSPLNPVVRAFPNGRVNCMSSGATPCPALTPSP